MSSDGNRTPANKMQDQVKRGENQVPRSVLRVDPACPSRFDRFDHVHFKDGSALYCNGEWKHGGRPLTNAEKEWLTKNGWTLPPQ